jgi:hypothetical protein
MFVNTAITLPAIRAFAPFAGKELWLKGHLFFGATVAKFLVSMKHVGYAVGKPGKSAPISDPSFLKRNCFLGFCLENRKFF